MADYIKIMLTSESQSWQIYRCGICKRLYSSKDDDGFALCLQCKPASSQPLLMVKHQLKRTIVMGVGKKMDDFDKIMGAGLIIILHACLVMEMAAQVCW